MSKDIKALTIIIGIAVAILMGCSIYSCTNEHPENINTSYEEVQEHKEQILDAYEAQNDFEMFTKTMYDADRYYYNYHIRTIQSVGEKSKWLRAEMRTEFGAEDPTYVKYYRIG